MKIHSGRKPTAPVYLTHIIEVFEKGLIKQTDPSIDVFP